MENNTIEVKILDWFCSDNQRQYCKNPELIKYLHLPEGLTNTDHLEVNLDLSMIHPDDNKKACRGWEADHLSKWVKENPDKIPNIFNFMCNKGEFQKVLLASASAPFGRKIHVIAIKLKQIIYFYSFSDDIVEYFNKKYDKSVTGRDTEWRSGLKFRQYFIGTKIGGINPYAPVTTHYETLLACLAEIGKFRILYATPADGLSPDVDLTNIDESANNDKIISTNTSDCTRYNYPEHRVDPRQHLMYSFHKLLTLWTKSLLTKSRSILTGFIDYSEKKVVGIEKIPIDVIENEIRTRKPQLFNKMIQNANKLFELMDETLQDDGEPIAFCINDIGHWEVLIPNDEKDRRMVQVAAEKMIPKALYDI